MFRLAKWYCDCVCPEGDVFLGYWARATWNRIGIPYEATVLKPFCGALSELAVVRHSPPPSMEEDAIQWRSQRLGFEGHWRATVPPCRQVLLDDATGSLVWNCCAPAAAAHVRMRDGRVLEGLGYVEQLTMTVAPRNLPFDELRWGRFVSERHSLTWISWRGRAARQWVFLDGVEVPRAVIGDRGVQLPAGRGCLEIGDATPLREGLLASTALRIVPGARFCLLRGIERASEAKWLSAGTMLADGQSSCGWVIHELIRVRPS
jgi:hypothetical protein